VKHTRREPCPNCPFRKDAPLAYWHPDEYLMLSRMRRTEGQPGASGIFGCHKDRHEPPAEREPCVGWLIYQREHGVASIALRLKLMQSAAALAQYEQSAATCELYDSIEELVEDNIERDQELHPERYGGPSR